MNAPRRRTTATLCLAAIAVAPAAAAAMDAVPSSPYAGWQGRPIKALSEQQVEDYRAGRGMSLALTAELNGYPGPRHVLDLADELHLTAAQRARTEALFEEMRAGAARLGERIIEREAALDRSFAEGAATAEAVHAAAVEIGRLQGELRTLHLRYHLATRDLLSQHQIARYAELRGYGASHRGGHGDGGRHGH